MIIIRVVLIGALLINAVLLLSIVSVRFQNGTVLLKIYFIRPAFCYYLKKINLEQVYSKTTTKNKTKRLSRISISDLINIMAAGIKLSKMILSNIHCKRFQLHINFGHQDPVISALGTGIIHSVIGITLIVLHRFFLVDFVQADLQVNPHFGSDVLSLDFDCIFTIAAAHIIGIGLKSIPLLFNLRGVFWQLIKRLAA